MIKNVAGIDLGGMLATFAPSDRPLEAGAECIARIRFCCRLLPGTYFFNAGVRGGRGQELRYLHRVLDALAFRVLPEADLTVTGMVDFSAGTIATVERVCPREQSR
jgi:lipopolysaccharide transport system ATP-binding protein